MKFCGFSVTLEGGHVFILGFIWLLGKCGEVKEKSPFFLRFSLMKALLKLNQIIVCFPFLFWRETFKLIEIVIHHFNFPYFTTF